MRSLLKPLLAALLAFSGLLAVAATPAAKNVQSGNSYHLYTKGLTVDDSGIVAVPARYLWSVETSFSGVDAQGKNLPDSRLLLRLYDPDQNFTALTAQMDLATAARLHQELGDVLAKKRKNPSFQHRPQLYDAKLIPTGWFRGIDEKGRAIIELEASR